MPQCLHSDYISLAALFLVVLYFQTNQTRRQSSDSGTVSHRSIAVLQLQLTSLLSRSVQTDSYKQLTWRAVLFTCCFMDFLRLRWMKFNMNCSKQKRL